MRVETELAPCRGLANTPPASRSARPAGSLLSVVSRLCGLHAQVMSCAELIVWSRVEGLNQGVVQRALLRPRVYRPQGWISPVLLVNGFMQGTWRHEMGSRGLEVVVQPFGTLPAWVRRAAAEEAGWLAGFLDNRLRFHWKA